MNKLKEKPKIEESIIKEIVKPIIPKVEPSVFKEIVQPKKPLNIMDNTIMNIRNSKRKVLPTIEKLKKNRKCNIIITFKF